MQNTPVDRAGSGGGSGGSGGGWPPGRGNDVALTTVTYVALVLFGMTQAALGTFFYSTGPGPLVSILFDLAILATCLLGGWGLGRPSGGLAPPPAGSSWSSSWPAAPAAAAS